ncbi:MAG: hypothetical protein EAX96_06870 [Candidatus Lokiarchaeota archaeon]|nr:hypothetical protein [Candidatus Lokiarchaeota archaeon]
MGFKRITKKDMETSLNQNLLGSPTKINEKLEKDLEFETESEVKAFENLTSAQILNEEVIKYSYYNSGRLKNLDGYGTISVVNVSKKDRIWDANLSISEESKTNLITKDLIKVGNLEPEQKKAINYEINKENKLDEPLKIYEKISVLNENISEETKIEAKSDKKNILIFGNNNIIKYSITLENISSISLKEINLMKNFSRDFKNFHVKSDEHPKIDITSNQIIWHINELKPKEKALITITTEILPKKKEILKSGDIEVNFTLDGVVLSSTEINHFSAFTHAMHSIRKKEKEKEPNNWECNLFFKNNSSYNLMIKNISVFDENMENKYFEFDSNSSNNPIKLLPGDRYETETWEIMNEKEPQFSRKIIYSLTYESKKSSKILISVDDTKFDIVDMELSKSFSETELNSFEESIINNKISLKNIGTIPINAILLREIIPPDFLPPFDVKDFQIRLSSGTSIQDSVNVSIMPPNDDPSTDHIVEISLNIQNTKSDFKIEVNDFIEVKYKIKAIAPDHTKNYQFPLEISSFFSSNPNSISPEELVEAKYVLSKHEEPKLHIIHRRRNIEIGKEIFPGRNIEEFGINIHIINKSEIEIKDLNISDSIPNNCEIVSSNNEYQIKKSEKDTPQTLSFNIKSIQPYEEKEIRYYIKSISGKTIDYAELESYIVS